MAMRRPRLVAGAEDERDSIRPVPTRTTRQQLTLPVARARVFLPARRAGVG
jgi:hypothetical protein